MHRLIANVLRGMGQRVAIDNVARLERALRDLAICCVVAYRRRQKRVRIAGTPSPKCTPPYRCKRSSAHTVTGKLRVNVDACAYCHMPIAQSHLFDISTFSRLLIICGIRVPAASWSYATSVSSPIGNVSNLERMQTRQLGLILLVSGC